MPRKILRKITKPTLKTHEIQFTPEEKLLLVNKKLYSKLDGKVVELSQTIQLSNGEKKKIRLIQRAYVHERVQAVSLEKNLAQKFQFQSIKPPVEIKVIPEENVELEYVLLSFKDQYISRSDMWHWMFDGMFQKCAFVGQRLEWRSMRATVQKMICKGKLTQSGFITNQTKFTFRTRSAETFMLFEMSEEMWEYAWDGNFYYEKAVDGFFNETLKRWENITNHALKIVFYGRYFLPEDFDKENIPSQLENYIVNLDLDQNCMDFYRVMDTEFASLAPQLLRLKVKEYFIQYPMMIKNFCQKYNIPQLTNARSEDSNILESLNLVLNAYEYHNINRDLNRTGQYFILISAGIGVYNVHNNALARITKKRISDNGIGIDIICLSHPPLHHVPLFRYVGPHYRCPDWINLYFSDYDIFQRINDDNFIPTGKCPELFVRSPGSEQNQNIPLPKLPTKSRTQEFEYNDHDQHVFKLSANQKFQRKRSSSKPNVTKDYHPHQSPQSTSPYRSHRPSSLGEQSGSAPNNPVPFRKKSSSQARSETSSPPVKQKISMHWKTYDPFQGSVLVRKDYKRKTTHQRRWGHLFPNSTLRNRNEIIKDINWTSIIEPAILPLTTDYWPGKVALSTYQQNTSNFIVEEPYTLKKLMLELICQRVQQGYQICIAPNQPKNHYYLALSNQYHEVILNTFQNGVTVNRYWKSDAFETQGKNRAQNNSLEYQHQYLIYNDLLGLFVSRSAIYNVNPISFNWNTMDNIVVGYIDELPSQLMARRVQYHLVPSDSAPSSTRGSSEGLGLSTFFNTLTSRIFKPVSNEDFSISFIELFDNVTERKRQSISMWTKDEYRYEWIELACKKEHFEGEAFYFQISWLVCSATTIDQYTQMLQRRAKQCGYEMFYTPIDSNIKDLSSPFRSYVKIPLPSKPEQRIAILRLLLEPQFNFYAEILPITGEPDTRFIHSTGSVIAHVDPDSLVWILNSFQSQQIQSDGLIQVLLDASKRIMSSDQTDQDQNLQNQDQNHDQTNQEQSNDDGKKSDE